MQLHIGESRDEWREIPRCAIAHLRFDAARRPGMTTSIYAFAEGLSPTRAIHADILALAASSGWPTLAAKSSQQ
jgi:hypothetical protein